MYLNGLHRICFPETARAAGGNAKRVSSSESSDIGEELLGNPCRQFLRGGPRRRSARHAGLYRPTGSQTQGWPRGAPGMGRQPGWSYLNLHCLKHTTFLFVSYHCCLEYLIDLRMGRVQTDCIERELLITYGATFITHRKECIPVRNG